MALHVRGAYASRGRALTAIRRGSTTLPPSNNRSHTEAVMIFEIEPFDNPDRTPCASAICDGRPAKWTITETNYPATSKKCCRLHLGHFIEEFTVAAGKATIHKGRRGR